MKKNYNKISILLLCLMILLVISGPLKAENDEKALRTFTEGEYLQYKVSYMWIRVGTLKLYNMGMMEKYGHPGNYIKIYVDSNPSIPFVNIHDTYETIMNNQSEPLYFLAYEDKGDYTLKTIYDFDYEQDSVYMFESKIFTKDSSEVVTMDSTTNLGHVYRDALSLLFYARKFSSTEAVDKDIYTFALAKKEKCLFEKSGLEKTVKIHGEKLPTYYLDGNIKFIGIAGIKDGFQGWFSQDNQRVPLQAKMKAFFGSVKIELEDFDNWDSNFADRLKDVLPVKSTAAN